MKPDITKIQEAVASVASTGLLGEPYLHNSIKPRRRFPPAMIRPKPVSHKATVVRRFREAARRSDESLAAPIVASSFDTWSFNWIKMLGVFLPLFQLKKAVPFL